MWYRGIPRGNRRASKPATPSSGSMGRALAASCSRSSTARRTVCTSLIRRRVARQAAPSCPPISAADTHGKRSASGRAGGRVHFLIAPRNSSEGLGRRLAKRSLGLRHTPLLLDQLGLLL